MVKVVNYLLNFSINSFRRPSIFCRHYTATSASDIAAVLNLTSRADVEHSVAFAHKLDHLLAVRRGRSNDVLSGVELWLRELSSTVLACGRQLVRTGQPIKETCVTPEVQMTPADIVRPMTAVGRSPLDSTSDAPQ